MFCNEDGLIYNSFITWNKEHKAKTKTDTGFSRVIIQSGEKLFALIHRTLLLLLDKFSSISPLLKNSRRFDGCLYVDFELWRFIHYSPMESYGICLSSCSCAEFLIQCTRAKDFQSVSFLFESIRQPKHASTDIYPLFLCCGYSSTIKCSSSLN